MIKPHSCEKYAAVRRVVQIFLFTLLTASVSLNAQTPQPAGRPISGVVSDETGEPLDAVTITIKNQSASAISDSAGRYRIEVPPSARTLVFSHVGRVNKEVQIGSSSIYNIIMLKDATSLDEVVVSTGYMTQKKADLTGAITLVTRDDFIKTPSANVMRSLQGKLPGVMITTDGNPAENVSIQVRGVTSLMGSPALIVMDGQPVNMNLRDINPNDIESMQVLKDAASASIYGARAAGGVILINTRKGRKGAAQVTYDGYVGVSKITGVPDMLNARQYGQELWQATVNDGDDPNTSIQVYQYDWGLDANGVPKLNSLTPRQWLNAQQTMPSSNTNWFKAGTRAGLQQSHQLTITGGSERSTSLFSLNYYKNEGTQITSFFERLSARFNNEYQLVKNRVTIGENFTISKLRIRDVNSTYAFLVMPPNIPVHDNTGGWGGVAMTLGMDDFNNPVRDLDINSDNIPNYLKILGSAFVNVKILDNLAFRTQFGANYNMEYDRTIQRAWTEAGGKSSTINGVTQHNDHNVEQTWTNTLTYNLQLRKNHFDVLAGMETYHYNEEYFSGYRSGILLETRDYAYLGSATGDSRTLSGGDRPDPNPLIGPGDRTILSYFGKINYAFDSKYLLSATLREDGASVFGANNRFGFFPAFSAGWRIDREKFMKKYDFISSLKLRVSYGVNGNSAPMSSAALVNIYQPNVDYTSYPIAGNATGSIPNGYLRVSIGNPNLKWESTTQTNIGLDFGLFGNKITGSFDWFDKVTTDMLFTPGYPGALGEGGFQIVNAANMSNKGFELLLTYANNSGKFTYSITGNASAYKNRVNSLPPSVTYSYGGNGLLDNIIGRPYNSIYGLVADGIFKTQAAVDNSAQQTGKGLGRIRYKDLDGDGVINPTYDQTWIGSKDPNLMAGLNFQAGYKNFDITFFFQGVFGNSVYDTWKELSDFWNIGVQNDRNHPSRILGAWTPNNPNSDIPAISRRDENGEKRLSSYFIENGSYVKLRTLDIGYNLPQHLVSKWGMSRLRVYVSAQNLLSFKKNWGRDQFTGGDPENPNEAYPMPLTTNLGLNVTF
jgi:TonB-linked SusC/RagA family outer membrane protein